jgi:ornithine lipid ester-linked acyl 2-hydroxylase
LRLHLGILCNEKSAIKVGDDIKEWKKGEVLIFDDYIMHEAWNFSNQTRIILLLDFKFKKDYIDDSIFQNSIPSYSDELSNLLDDVDNNKIFQ